MAVLWAFVTTGICKGHVRIFYFLIYLFFDPRGVNGQLGNHDRDAPESCRGKTFPSDTKICNEVHNLPACAVKLVSLFYSHTCHGIYASAVHAVGGRNWLPVVALAKCMQEATACWSECDLQTLCFLRTWLRPNAVEWLEIACVKICSDQCWDIGMFSFHVHMHTHTHTHTNKQTNKQACIHTPTHMHI